MEGGVRRNCTADGKRALSVFGDPMHNSYPLSDVKGRFPPLPFSGVEAGWGGVGGLAGGGGGWGWLRHCLNSA